MASITTRAGKGSPLTHAEVDANFNNLNNGKLDISTAPAGSVTVDSSGRVGIGTASPIGKVDITGTSVPLILQSTVAAANYITHRHVTSGDIAYIGNGGGGALTAGTTSDYAIRANLGSLIFACNGDNERARIDTSGRLLVGTGSSRQVNASINALQFQIEGLNYQSSSMSLVNNQNQSDGSYVVFGKSRGTSLGSSTIVNSGDSLGALWFCGADGNTMPRGAIIEAAVDGTPGASDMPGRLVFSTTADGASSPTERMRIDNTGVVLIGSTSYQSGLGANTKFQVTSPGGDWALGVVNSTTTAANNYGIRILYGSGGPNGTANEFLYCGDPGVLRASIRSNGGLANYQANNVNLSDINTKKDVSPAASTWDCLKEWEIVNYRYKDQPDDADLSLGVIAQQVAESCPEVITVFQEAKEATETEPAQEERLGVKEQQMYWMAIKALQEAQVRIETLEAKVAALEASS